MDPAGPYKRPCPYSLVNTGNNSVRPYAWPGLAPGLGLSFHRPQAMAQAMACVAVHWGWLNLCPH